MSDDSTFPRELKTRLVLYSTAVELRAKGLSRSQIASKLGISVEIIGYWLRGHKPKRVKRYEPDLTPSKDLAYVAGFYLGDGKEAGEEHKVRFELADKGQLDYVGSLVAKILGREAKALGRDGSFYTVDYDSVVLSNFLNQEVEKLVEHLKGYLSDFLRGFFDAEGCVTCAVNIRRCRVGAPSVGLANTNLDYLKLVTACLRDSGIDVHSRITNKKGQIMTIRGRSFVRRKGVYHLTITSISHVKRFLNIIGFANKSKAGKLKDLIRMSEMEPEKRFAWFMSRYGKEGRKWVRIRQTV